MRNVLPAHVPADTQRAWEEQRADLDVARLMMLEQPYAADPIVRAQGLYLIQMLQAFAFNIYLAPRQRYPNFYSQTIFLPFESSFGAPCPDFCYYWTFLDGRRTYRITGKIGTTRWIEFQMIKGFWGDRDMRSLGNFDFDKCIVDPDGRFEIIASAQEHADNWLRLGPEMRNITVLTREAWYDWENDVGIKLEIECLDGDAAPVAHSEEEINRRIRAAGYLARFDVEFFVKMNNRVLEAVGLNRFYMPPMNAHDDVGGNPRACYLHMIYDIGPEDALLIEVDVPQARFWSIQLADMWWQTTDYAHHHSSLNGHQVSIDADGKCRIVISHRDPGVPNWLDPVEPAVGVAQWRWYLAETHPVPTVTKMPLDEIREHLPAGTPVVTAEQRAAVVARRRRAALRRHGFYQGEAA